ncbi:hypothetical protein PINS_up001631 [Pythium insidiosum]|nr:hypothetical protein PINS_up001631 [Pythium insidiosum]
MVRYGIVNNLGDWANILVNFSICLWRFFCQSNPTRKKLLEIESFETYVPALSLALWDEVLLAMNICNMLLLTARTLKYFQVTNGGRRLMNSVYGAMPEVLSFLPIYVSVIMGYTFAGHMLYGLSFAEWSTFPRALFRVFEMNFGLYDPGPIYDAGGYLSAIYIYSSTVVFCILMLNVFMAIVMSTWEQLSEREAEKAKERAEFAMKLTYIDMLHLIFMKEDAIDTLVDVAISLEEHELISLSLFAKEFKATGLEIAPAVWERITQWYWDGDSKLGTDVVKPSLPVLRSPAKSPTIGDIGVTDDVVVIHSARELDANANSTLQFKSSVLAASKGPATAKITPEITH